MQKKWKKKKRKKEKKKKAKISFREYLAENINNKQI